MALIVLGLGLDGLDGWLHRRSGAPGTVFGRVADSLADAITFGVAPGVLIAYHPYHAALWAPFRAGAFAVGLAIVLFAWARLTWFTLRAFDRPNFVGAPTPQNALGVIVLLLLFATPAFLGTSPALVLSGALVLALLMVSPFPFPKMRRGARLRLPMVATGIALVVALLPIQFGPAPDSSFYELSFAATLVASVGVALYYLAGPFTVPRPAARPGSA